MSSVPGAQRKQLRSSGLRNEIHPESSDDERLIEEPDIQVPDSQAAIPETQLDNYGVDFGSEADGLSPDARALLARTGISKEKRSLDAIPFTVSLLSKEMIDRAASPESGFSFQPMAPRKAPALERPVQKGSVDSVTQSDSLESLIGHADRCRYLSSICIACY